MQLELPELALSPSIMNPTVSWTVMQTHVCWENMHTFSRTMGRQLTLLGMTKARGHLQTTLKLYQEPLPMTTQPLTTQ